MLLFLACSIEQPIQVDVGTDTDAAVEEEEPSPTCLSDDELAVFEDWLYATWLVAYGGPSSASASSVVSFYELPGVPAATWFSLSLQQPCTTQADLDAVCTGGVCYQVECLSTGWVNHIQNDGDLPEDDVTDFGGWTVERGRLPLTWEAGETSLLTLEYDVKQLLSPDGADWTLTGLATFDGTLTLTATFAALREGSTVVVAITHDAGEITVDGEAVATWADQALVVTEACTPA